MKIKLPVLLISALAPCIPAFSAPIANATTSCSILLDGGAVLTSQTGTSSVRCDSHGGSYAQASAGWNSFGVSFYGGIDGIAHHHPTLPFTYSRVSGDVVWENQLVITGGTGAGEFRPEYFFEILTGVPCSFLVDGTEYRCSSSVAVPFTFGTPFAVRVALRLELAGFSPQSTFGNFRLGSPGTVFQGGNPVTGFTLVEVPEPSSVGLSALGLASGAWLMRRRRRH